MVAHDCIRRRPEVVMFCGTQVVRLCDLRSVCVSAYANLNFRKQIKILEDRKLSQKLVIFVIGLM